MPKRTSNCSAKTGKNEAVAVIRSAQLGATLIGQEVDLVTFFLKSATGKKDLVMHPVLPPPTDSTPQPWLQ